MNSFAQRSAIERYRVLLHLKIQRTFFRNVRPCSILDDHRLQGDHGAGSCLGPKPTLQRTPPRRGASWRHQGSSRRAAELGRYPLRENLYDPHRGLSSLRVRSDLSRLPPSAVYREFGTRLVWEEWMGGNRNGDLYYPGLVFEFDARDSERPLADARLRTINGNARDDVFFRGRLLCAWNQSERQSIFTGCRQSTNIAAAR